MTDTVTDTSAEASAEDSPSVPTTPDGIPLIVNGKELTPVQIAALREARARREEAQADGPGPREINGADRSTDPTRYGDWEKAGRAVDFS